MPSWPTRISVCTASGLVDHHHPPGGVGRPRRRRRGHLAPRPVAERLGHGGHRLVDADVAHDGQQAVVRRVVGAVEGQQVLARHSLNGLHRAVAGRAVRMDTVDQAVEHHVGEVLGVLVSHLQPRQDLLALALELLRREGRVAQDVGEQPHSQREIVLHHHHVDEGKVTPQARAQQPSRAVDRLGHLLRRCAWRCPGRAASTPSRPRRASPPGPGRCPPARWHEGSRLAARGARPRRPGGRSAACAPRTAGTCTSLAASGRGGPLDGHFGAWEEPGAAARTTVTNSTARRRSCGAIMTGAAHAGPAGWPA